MARTQVRAETQINNAWSSGTNYFLRADGSTPLEGNLDANGTNKITNLADPTNAGDAVNKSYLEAFEQGLDPKGSVRAATDGTDLALDGSDSDTIDGVTLVAGDRLLVKDQTTASENGIYVVDSVTTSQITVSRAADMDEDSEVNGGEYTFVREGTANADIGYVVTSDSPTLDTDPINWGQFTGTGGIVAGDGLTKNGDTIDAVAADGSITMNADSFAVNHDSTNLTTPTTETTAEGIRVGTASSGNLLIGQDTGSSEPTTFETMGGDVSSLAADGTVTIATAGNVITSTGTGIKLNKATAGYVILGKGTASGDPDVDFTQLGGDVSGVAADGTVTLASSVVKQGDVKFRESFSGDGTTTTFTLSNTPVTESNTSASYKELVFLNGVLQVEGASADYTKPNDNDIAFNNAPLSGDPIRVLYVTA